MRVWLALAIVCLCSVVLAACTSSATTPGKLRIITEVYPPYNFIDKEKNVMFLQYLLDLHEVVIRWSDNPPLTQNGLCNKSSYTVISIKPDNILKGMRTS